jgi:hypothetical protein
MNLKLLFGILSIIPAVIAYFFYFRDMLRGKTKPHAFSWLIWGLLAGNGFLAQVSAHAGIGAWVTGLTAVASLTIFCFALKIGATKPTFFDWMLLGLALSGLLLLFVVKNEEVALGLTLLALAAGFAMNIRKAYRLPLEESAISFWLNALKFVPAIFALAHITFLTAGYPLTAALGNAAVALVVQLRCRQIVRKQSGPDAAPLG